MSSTPLDDRLERIARRLAELELLTEARLAWSRTCSWFALCCIAVSEFAVHCSFQCFLSPQELAGPSDGCSDDASWTDDDGGAGGGDAPPADDAAVSGEAAAAGAFSPLLGRASSGDGCDDVGGAALGETGAAAGEQGPLGDQLRRIVRSVQRTSPRLFCLRQFPAPTPQSSSERAAPPPRVLAALPLSSLLSYRHLQSPQGELATSLRASAGLPPPAAARRRHSAAALGVLSPSLPRQLPPAPPPEGASLGGAGETTPADDGARRWDDGGRGADADKKLSGRQGQPPPETHAAAAAADAFFRPSTAAGAYPGAPRVAADPTQSGSTQPQPQQPPRRLPQRPLYRPPEPFARQSGRQGGPQPPPAAAPPPLEISTAGSAGGGLPPLLSVSQTPLTARPVSARPGGGGGGGSGGGGIGGAGTLLSPGRPQRPLGVAPAPRGGCCERGVAAGTTAIVQQESPLLTLADEAREIFLSRALAYPARFV